MTLKRIYIRGNVADPRNLNIYDADTDREVHVIHLELDVVPRAVYAKITLAPTTAHLPSIRVEVVAGPPCPWAGKVLKEVELEQYRRHSTTVHKATVTEWGVQPDGTVKPDLKTQFQQQHAVDDILLAQSGVKPGDILEDSARQVLTGVMHHMISPQLAAAVKAGTTKPMQTGGVMPNPHARLPGAVQPGPGYTAPGPSFKIKSVGLVPKVGNFKMPTLDSTGAQKAAHSGKSDSNSKAVCSECGGSGEYICQISNKKSDCSQGCKRPTK